MAVNHRNGKKGKKNHKNGNGKKNQVSQSAMYGITKTVNHAGFYAFTEKLVIPTSITAQPGTAEAPLMSGCAGAYNTNLGWAYNLQARPPFTTDNVFGARQADSYAELFSYWRITGVRITVTPNADVKTAAASITNKQVPTLWYFFDSNKGAQTPLNFDIVQRKTRVKYRRLDRPRTFFFKPTRTLLAIKDPNATTALANEQYIPDHGDNTWISTQAQTPGYDPGLTRYSGMHWGVTMSGFTEGDTLPLTVFMKVYYEFKGNR